MIEEDLSYTIRNIQQQLSANKTASCYKFLKDELQEQWKPIQQLHHEIMANEPNIEVQYLKSQWALKEKYHEIMEELYIKIQNNQSIPLNSLPQMQLPIFSGSYEEYLPSPICSRESFIKINPSVKQENSSTQNPNFRAI
ncbi:hypothetical protein JTB14_006404 [Gonioctena quinquepunctata]|nr:hypothetical protein JTB14_006404 [Gonioctena quinquepunctata]